MKKVIEFVLFALIIVMGYLLYESIQKPIRFNKEKDIRYEATIERLKDIRRAQVAYRSRYGKYTGSFDTLIHFLKTDSFAIVKAIGEVPDTLTEKKALEQGLITRDTTFVSVKDSLFKKSYYIDSLQYVPYTDQKKFNLGAGTIETGSKVKVKVFEASVKNKVLLKGLDEQLIVNLNDRQMKITGFPGLKVGSLEEATNNAGNWE